ncbi:MAG: carbamate kinase [Rhodospirillales bacterium]|nr:carbamate kinase [Rhodospirillales bacterium]
MGETKKFPKRLLVAIGGNAILPAGHKGTPDEQAAIAASTGRALRPLMELKNELIITHGNGPSVGMELMRQALSRERVAAMPLDICVAHTQGGIAYLLMQALENALREVGNPRHVVCLLTQVEVDPNDPAFRDPTKPVGYFYTVDEAQALTRELGWRMREDSNRGWRLVVPSPKPRHIVDISLIDALAKRGAVVIAGGGGGIPVVRDTRGVRHGIEAVIDKDLTSAHMANVLGITDMIILTAVKRVAIHFGTPAQRELDQVTLSEIRAYRDQGHFPAGSMGPKIDAAIRFLEGGGRRAVIGHLDEAVPALAGEAGTHIVADAR